MTIATAGAPIKVEVNPSDPIKSAIAACLPVVREIRHDLHRHPEIMFEEKRTSAVVARELAAIGIDHRAGLAGGTGVLGFLPATRSPAAAKTIALRADMDALPILESTGKPYASTNPGVMHACGHDGHTSMLLGAARALASLPDRPNHVLFIFQPAEEGGAGAEKMCEAGVLSGKLLGTPADTVYGMHGWPELPLGQVATRTGPLMAATDEFTITIRGKGGHAAYPHLCIDPVVVASYVITALQTIASRCANPLDSVVCTVGSLHGGHANNVIPNEVVLIGTMRTLKPATRQQAEQHLKRIAESTAAAHGASAIVEWHVGYPAVENHPEPTERFRRIALEAFGPARVIEREHPTMGGEDFSYYGKHVPACFFFLGLKPAGADSYPNLHTPEFDFNDDALPVGIEAFCRLAAAPSSNLDP